VELCLCDARRRLPQTWTSEAAGLALEVRLLNYRETQD
jgi:hypothetical protein